MKKVHLKPKREASLQRFHPWVFSGAVAKQESDLQEGDWVEVRSHRDEFLGAGHYQNGSICVRILTFEPVSIGTAFWTQKLERAYQFRLRTGLAGNPETTCYRLIHAEGDGLPGLIIDLYGDTAVIQCHSIGMHRDRADIVAALQAVLGPSLKAVYDKSAETLPTQYAGQVTNQYLLGESAPVVVLENGCSFRIDWESGQKTGFFLDQRDNRSLLAHYASGKTVLNAFSYSGGFSVYALRAGAAHVDSVDVSPKAIELANQNVALNGFDDTRHAGIAADVLKYLQQTERMYDLMIVDPPAFAKSLEKRHKAVQGYKRLNAMALSKLAPGGILFTFSCSQVVDKQLFYDTLVAAALEAGRQIRVMHTLSQPPDHPVNIFHPEGGYLKGLVLYVE